MQIEAISAEVTQDEAPIKKPEREALRSSAVCMWVDEAIKAALHSYSFAAVREITWKLCGASSMANCYHLGDGDLVDSAREAVWDLWFATQRARS